MKNLTILKGSIALIAISMIFTSCKKEEITSKKSILQSENHEVNLPSYKFSSVVKIYGENTEDGFLTLSVSSDDEIYLEQYVAKLKQAAISFKESDPSNEGKLNPILEEKSESSVYLSFEWSNYHFNLEKGKIYGVFLTSKNDSKALVYYNSFSNCSGFTSGNGFAAVNIYDTYTSHNSLWSLSNNANSLFYQKLLSYNDNLEVRTFTYTPVFGNIYSSFVLNGVTVYYRPRLNYVSPEMPSFYTDYNSIGYGNGIDNTNGNGAGSTLTVYKAG